MALAGRKQQRAKRPHIYGDEKKARAALARQIARGDELLSQAPGVRNRIVQAQATQRARAKKSPPTATGPFSLRLVENYDLGDYIAGEWVRQMRSWRERTQRVMRDYLQEQFVETLPALVAAVSPLADKPRYHVSLDNGEPWLRTAVDELRQMQAALGVQRVIAPSPPAPTRFAELLGSGLIDAKVVRDHAKSMTTALRTPKQLNDAIGAAKELTEATLRGALDQLGETPRSRDDLPTLMKTWRTAIGEVAPGKPGAEVLARALSTHAAFLAEWRNKYGRGHGRTRYPAGVRARHARLAIDTAETCIRFVVTTMDDLQRLPP